MSLNLKIEGMKELQKSMKKLGSVPQKHVTSSARKGMNIVKSQAKSTAPYDEGNLKKGIILKGERSRYKSKKVYKIIFDPKMNDVFQKSNGYYPFSQEYGFFTKNGRYIPGFRFVRDSLIDNVGKIEKVIVSEMKKKIDTEIAKARLR